jgi:hypothetical protein
MAQDAEEAAEKRRKKAAEEQLLPPARYTRSDDPEAIDDAYGGYAKPYATVRDPTAAAPGSHVESLSRAAPAASKSTAPSYLASLRATATSARGESSFPAPSSYLDSDRFDDEDDWKPPETDESTKLNDWLAAALADATAPPAPVQDVPAAPSPPRKGSPPPPAAPPPEEDLVIDVDGPPHQVLNRSPPSTSAAAAAAAQGSLAAATHPPEPTRKGSPPPPEPTRKGSPPPPEPTRKGSPPPPEPRGAAPAGPRPPKVVTERLPTDWDEQQQQQQQQQRARTAVTPAPYIRGQPKAAAGTSKNASYAYQGLPPTAQGQRGVSPQGSESDSGSPPKPGSSGKARAWSPPKNLTDWSPPRPPPQPASPPLDLTKLDQSELSRLAEMESTNGVPLTPGGSTPFRSGFVKNISNKWTEFHSVPRLPFRITTSGRRVEDKGHESARAMAPNSFTRRRNLLEEIVGSPPERKRRNSSPDRMPFSRDGRSSYEDELQHI